MPLFGCRQVHFRQALNLDICMYYQTLLLLLSMITALSCFLDDREVVQIWKIHRNGVNKPVTSNVIFYISPNFLFVRLLFCENNFFLFLSVNVGVHSLQLYSKILDNNALKILILLLLILRLRDMELDHLLFCFETYHAG